VGDRADAVTSASELNKRKVRLFIEAVCNEGRLELIDELVANDYVGHVRYVPDRVLGAEGVRAIVISRRRAYPDLHVKIEDQIAEEDRVAMRWRITSHPQAGSRCWAGISIVRLLAGKQVDSHTEYTELTRKPARGRRTAGDRTIP
jgi:predicted SnoaL-like aldol condensation-catalyzing enzyme